MEMIKFQAPPCQSINMATNLFSTCASDHLSSWNFQQVEPRWSPSRLRSICGAEGWMWWSLIYWHQAALLHLMLIIQCTHHAHYCPGCHSPKIGKVFSFEMLIDMVDIMDFIRHRPRAKGSASSSYHLWCLQMSLPNKSNTCIIFCYCWQVFSMQITCILMEKNMHIHGKFMELSTMSVTMAMYRVKHKHI